MGEFCDQDTLKKSDVENLERSMRGGRGAAKEARGTRDTRLGLVRALKQAIQTNRDVVVLIGESDASPARIGSFGAGTEVAPAEDVDTVLSTGALAERLLPSGPLPSVGQVWQAQRNAEARWELLTEFGAYTSQDIGQRRSRASNQHALANRWRSEGKVFAVEHGGQLVYPGFQFNSETLAARTVVARVLDALPTDTLSDWEVALWWTAANGWLDGARPVDVSDERPDAVVAAAAKLAEPSGL